MLGIMFILLGRKKKPLIGYAPAVTSRPREARRAAACPRRDRQPAFRQGSARAYIALIDCRRTNAMFGFKKIAMPNAERGAARPRPRRSAPPTEHFVNHHPLKGPYPEGSEKALFGLGCFWGAETQVLGAGRRHLCHRRRLCRRRDAQSDLRGSLLGPHRPQRGGAGGLRPEEDFLRDAAQDLLGKPRPDARHAPGQRRRHAVSLRHLHLHARAEARPPRRRRRCTRRS